jgi:hypothetical protein
MPGHTGRWAAGALALGLIASVAGTTQAAWTHDPFVPVLVGATAMEETDTAVVADGAGGAIVVWCDSRDYPPLICAQRVSADGELMWDPAGVVISHYGSDPYNFGETRPVVVSDGAGGAIVAWSFWWRFWHATGSCQTAIQAQRVTADGAVMWGSNGVTLCAASGNRGQTAIAADGAGGAVVAWCDNSDLTGEAPVSDIYAQKVSADGIAQWANDGEVVFAGATRQSDPAVTGDGAGGAVIACAEYDTTTGTGTVRAQRLAVDGSSAWSAGGEVLCLPWSDYISVPAIVEDGAGGVIVAWPEGRDGVDTTRAQRLGHSGVAQWTPGGVVLCGTAGWKAGLAIVGDGAGGAIVAWQDYRSADGEIYGQRVSAAGVLQWASTGLPIATGRGETSVPAMASDGAGGALVAWTESPGPSGMEDIFAQRISPTGAALWSDGGATIGIGRIAQFSGGIVSDGAGGAIVAWSDYRALLDTDAVAQWIDADGATFRSEPVISSVRDITPDQGGKVRLRWAASNLDHPALGMATYGVWRQVSAAKDGAPTWESIGTVMARGEASYTFTASTFADSCAAGSASSTFMVDYHLLLWGDSWESNPATGCSIDNLAPARPANVHLTAGGRLAWDTAVEPDFRQYAVYGSPVAYLDANATVVERTTNNSLDIGGLAYPYLLVTASDIHDNESAAGAASALSGVDVSSPAGLRLELFPAHPNPFNPRTSLAFTLPQAGAVRITIFDLAGRAVRTLVDASLPPGRHEADWDGRDAQGHAVGSGSYVARLECDGRVEVTRLELVR